MAWALCGIAFHTTQIGTELFSVARDKDSNRPSRELIEHSVLTSYFGDPIKKKNPAKLKKYQKLPLLCLQRVLSKV